LTSNNIMHRVSGLEGIGLGVEEMYLHKKKNRKIK